jgi:hypothetical protein
MKHLEHTLETYVYSHCNVCNILIYFCNIHIKHLQHISKNLKHLKHILTTCDVSQCGLLRRMQWGAADVVDAIWMEKVVRRWFRLPYGPRWINGSFVMRLLIPYACVGAWLII